MDNEDTNKITREQVERAMDAAVPQPEPWYARLVRLAQEAQSAGQACAEAEAAFKVADAEREKVRLARAAARDACHAARKALTEATTARAIVEAAQRPASVQPTRPEPRYKVGDWVRDGDGTARLVVEAPQWSRIQGQWRYLMASWSYSESELTPAIDPALRETARKTVAWLRGGPSNRYIAIRAHRQLPGAAEWDADYSGDYNAANARWAAQLERLLGDAP